ncbi:MAG TPA: TonB-dependent receptor, partial [Candidatus Bathyarchaeia archaeon]|nr:TonB-dependent receptor [Candidatus Bathyarchaeia archaeon]
FRQPSFTELYYTSPTNIPNADLQLQQSDNYEWGLAYETSAFSAAGDLFYRHQRDTIDWVRNAGDTKFQAINAGKVDVRGIDFSAGMPIDLKIFNRARISYTRLHVDKQSSYDISKYVFDYLRDRAVTTLSADYGRWHYGLDAVFEYHLDLKERWIFNAQLRYDIANQAQVFLIGENIFDEDYEEYPFIDGEPLFVKAGVEVRF